MKKMADVDNDNDQPSEPDADDFLNEAADNAKGFTPKSSSVRSKNSKLNDNQIKLIEKIVEEKFKQLSSQRMTLSKKKTSRIHSKTNVDQINDKSDHLSSKRGHDSRYDNINDGKSGRSGRSKMSKHSGT